jgi:glucosaminylphosphatidylinositol acyltransferase
MRQANLSYILWVAAFNTTSILIYLVLEIVLKTSTPPLLEAINKNGLIIFLLANVATGIINLAIPTVHTPDLIAFAILSVYTFSLSLFAWSFRNVRLLRL